MKKTTCNKLLITLIFFIFITKAQIVYAWDDCPKDKVNDPYPGDCARYIDTDNNGICDHSESAPEDRVIENTFEEIPSEDTFINKEVDTSENSVVQKQLTPTNIPSNNGKGVQDLESTIRSKVFTSILLVITHLAVILIYVNYKKAKLQKS